MFGATPQIREPTSKRKMATGERVDQCMLRGEEGILKFTKEHPFCWDDVDNTSIEQDEASLMEEILDYDSEEETRLDALE